MFSALLCVTASEPEIKSKNEKDKLKEKYPALCKPDAPVWTVRFTVIRKGGKNLTPLQCVMLSTVMILHPSGSTASHGYKG